NLIMATSSTGNFSGIDVAIGIRSSSVDLDLNGFSIIVTNSNPNIGHAFYAIAELGTFSQISVRNGNIALITAGTGSDVNLANLPVAIYLHTSTQNNLAELAVTNNFTSAAVGVPVLVQGFIFDVGMTSLVRHCRFSRGLSRATCPSLIVENSGVSDLGYPAPCVAVHNSP